MNRHICEAFVLAVALAGVATTPGSAQVAADVKRTTRPAKTIKDIAALRTMLYRALNNLDAADSRFDNGMLTEWERDAMYRVVVRVLVS